MATSSDPYTQDLSTILADLQEKQPRWDRLENRWRDSVVTEEARNFQRLHLFDQAAEADPSCLNEMYTAIHRWIGLYPQMTPLADDPFNCALRIINWLRIVRRAGDEQTQSMSNHSRIADYLLRQMRHVYRRIEYEVPGNHVLFELYSVWLTAMLFRERSECQAMARKAGSRLRREMVRQFSPCGYHQEHSPHYHLQSTLLAQVWVEGLRGAGEAPDPELTELLRHAIQYLSLLRNQFELPRIGDNCYCLFTRSGSEDLRLFDRLARSGPDNDLEGDLPLIRQIPNHYLVAFAEHSKLIVNTGSFAFRNNPGHDHSDLLSFVYLRDGKQLLIDPGTRSYEGDAESLAYRRSKVHNTISVNGGDQALLWAPFRWAYLPKLLSLESEIDGDRVRIEGVYRVSRKRTSYVHKRRFILDSHSLRIEDEIEGSGQHELSLGFVVGQEMQVEFAKNGVMIRNHSTGFELETSAPVGVEVSVAIDRFDFYPDYALPISTKSIHFEFKSVNLPLKIKTDILTGI